MWFLLWCTLASTNSLETNKNYLILSPHWRRHKKKSCSKKLLDQYFSLFNLPTHKVLLPYIFKKNYFELCRVKISKIEKMADTFKHLCNQSKSYTWQYVAMRTLTLSMKKLSWYFFSVLTRNSLKLIVLKWQ